MRPGTARHRPRYSAPPGTLIGSGRESAPPSRRRMNLRRAAGLVLAALTTALAILVLFTPSVFSTVLRGAGLWPHGDRYTALYFSDPNALLGQSGAGAGLPVAFTVESHEAARRTYSFQVSVGRNADAQRVVRTGTLTLDPGRSRVESVQLRPSPERHRLVEIRLSGGDNISYWTS